MSTSRTMLTEPQLRALREVARFCKRAMGYATWDLLRGSRVRPIVVDRLWLDGLVSYDSFNSFSGRPMIMIKITDAGRKALRAAGRRGRK